MHHRKLTQFKTDLTEITSSEHCTVYTAALSVHKQIQEKIDCTFVAKQTAQAIGKERKKNCSVCVEFHVKFTTSCSVSAQPVSA